MLCAFLQAIPKCSFDVITPLHALVGQFEAERTQLQLLRQGGDCELASTNNIFTCLAGSAARLECWTQCMQANLRQQSWITLAQLREEEQAQSPCG